MLPPTECNAHLHGRRAHLQVLLWKAADRPNAPIVDITKFGWDIQKGPKEGNDVIMPSVATGPIAPPGLMDVISCRCKARQPCASPKCSCKAAGLACTTYCFCQGCEGTCLSPNTQAQKTRDNEPGVEDGLLEDEDIEDKDCDGEDDEGGVEDVTWQWTCCFDDV